MVRFSLGGTVFSRGWHDQPTVIRYSVERLLFTVALGAAVECALVGVFFEKMVWLLIVIFQATLICQKM